MYYNTCFLCVLPVIYVLTYMHVCIANQSFCITGHLCINRHSRLYYEFIFSYYRSFMYYHSLAYVLQNHMFVLPVMYVLSCMHVCIANQSFCTTGHLCIVRHPRVYYEFIFVYYRSSMYYHSFTCVLQNNNYELPAIYVLTFIYVCSTHA